MYKEAGEEPGQAEQDGIKHTHTQTGISKRPEDAYGLTVGSDPRNHVTRGQKSCDKKAPICSQSCSSLTSYETLSQAWPYLNSMVTFMSRIGQPDSHLRGRET